MHQAILIAKNRQKRLIVSSPAPELLIWAVTFFLAFSVYAVTVPGDLTWANYGGDGGELIAASVTLGLPHPPGYPTYVLLGKLASLIPVGTIAFRYNLFSALAMAVSAGFVAMAASNLLAETRKSASRSAVGIAAGLTFAFNLLVWGQAMIAEVYALNLAFLTAFIWIVTRDPENRRPVLAGLLIGLSVSSHLTSILVLPLALILTPSRCWPRLWLGFGIGLLPFALVPILAKTNSPVIWGDPTTFERWLAHVSGQLYRPNVLAPPLAEWGKRIVQWGTGSLSQFIMLGLPFVVLGLTSVQLSSQRRTRALVVTSGLFAVYAIGYGARDAIVFILPAIMLLSVVLALGLRRVGWASLFLPLVLVALNLNVQDSIQGSAVRDAVGQSLQLAPANALMLTPGDQSIASLWYFHHVEGQRPDLTFVDANLFQFDWYRKRLERLDPYLRHLDADDLDGFVRINGQFRPVCFISLVDASGNRCLHPPI